MKVKHANKELQAWQRTVWSQMFVLALAGDSFGGITDAWVALLQRQGTGHSVGCRVTRGPLVTVILTP